MTITDLIEKLEKAEGPDRWLDAQIDATLRVGTVRMNAGGYEWAWDNFPVWAHHKQQRGMCGVRHDNGDLGLVWDSLAFTGSIDAALAILDRALPGWHYSVGSCPADFLTPGIDKPFTAELMGPVSWRVIDREVGEEPIYDSASGSAETAPLALCLAILRAKAAQDGDA